MKSDTLAKPGLCQYVAEDGKHCIVGQVLKTHGATDEMLRRHNTQSFASEHFSGHLRQFASERGLDLVVLQRAQSCWDSALDPDGSVEKSRAQVAELLAEFGVHVTTKSFINAVAKLVEETPSEKLSQGAYLKPNGCMCAATLVVYASSEKVKKAIDGMALLREAGAVDEDQLDIITSQVDDVIHTEFRALVGALPNSFELHNAIIRTFDANFSVTKDAKAAANALRALAEANEV